MTQAQVIKINKDGTRLLKSTTGKYFFDNTVELLQVSKKNVVRILNGEIL